MGEFIDFHIIILKFNSKIHTVKLLQKRWLQ